MRLHEAVGKEVALAGGYAKDCCWADVQWGIVVTSGVL
jgi:hypothetical protein